jgi:hypothetical protein
VLENSNMKIPVIPLENITFNNKSKETDTTFSPFKDKRNITNTIENSKMVQIVVENMQSSETDLEGELEEDSVSQNS